VPERERVLAAGDRHEDVLVFLEHAVLPDGLTDLIPEEVDKVRSAEGGIVAAQLEHRRPTALPALHRAPPDMTGLSSMVSASRTTWSAVMSSSPRITRTVSGRMSSSRSTSFTRRPPATSTSRRGLRSTTFIASRPRESRRRFHVEDLLQMTRLVARLQAPPLAEVHLAETEVLERQPARVTAAPPLDRLSAT